ncbi:MAG: DUF2723 domain-containing protein, partial [candidate division Zixibacteria bacterium]|nr:DUF2723 domain-containing protein [candidate division Zixibacteria bacterium]
MPAITSREPEQFDRTNAILAGVVFVISFIVYAITVQRSFSFWDCGEFIACSATLGVPHPPGTPLFVLVGRVFSMFPFVEDVSYRINYISVISSALTAMFSYLLIVKLVRHFFKADEAGSLSRLICYAGGVAGAFFVAFSATNWSNAVEAEVYGLGLALSVAIVWLTVKYFENRGTPAASRIILLVMYLAMVGVGIHMTVFLVVPVCAIFFILNERATARDYMMICVYAILELTFIMLFSNGRAGYGAFMAVSAILGIVLFALLWRKINWGILIAIMVCSSIMISFSLYLLIALPFGALAILGLAYLSKQYGWKVDWQVALGILLVGLIGFSVHMYIPIRSSQGPRIDENNPSRDFRTFVNFLDRKQYGQVSMSERMFERRGSWSHQLGRHANMGFWSYFEEQYSAGGWWFVPLFLLGLLGMVVAIFKRLEIGLP